MSEQMRIILNGETLVLDCGGALFWPAERTLVVSDVHFEKGSSLARRGVMLPPYDTHVSLKRLSVLLERYAPARVISLGDSFHDAEGTSRLGAEERDLLMRFVSALEWIWIAGNHDPETPCWLGGAIAEEVAIGGLIFRHEPSANADRGEIAGHLHPCTHVTRHGRTLRRRCFITDGLRMVMPAFGAFTGGLDVRDEAFAALFRQSYLAYALGSQRVYAVSGKAYASLRKTREGMLAISAGTATAEY